MVVAETLAGIALAKSAVSGVKAMIDTCKDVHEISHHIDDLFSGYDQSRRKVAAKNQSKKGDKKWNKYLTSKFKDSEEEVGVSLSDVTAEVIEQKQIEEQMKSMRIMLNKRFGADTWNEIIELRNKRVKELKESHERARKVAEANVLSNQNLLKEVWKWTWQISFIIGFMILVWGWLSYASKGKIPFIW
jgi:hypothetical protein